MKWFCYALLITQSLIVIGAWGWDHVHHPLGNQLTGDSIGQMLAYGRLTGLLATLCVLLQLVLIGRFRWVERAFGLDRLMRLHHFVGFTFLLFLIAHPILLTLGHAAQSDTSAKDQFLEFMNLWKYVAAATVAFGIMVMALAFSVVVMLKRIRYEWWYATHLTLYLAIVLAFGHQIAVGSDFTDHRWFRYYWIGLNAFVLVNLLWYRFGLPLWQYRRHRFKVTSVVPEAPGVYSVYLEGSRLSAYPVRAGQFAILRFLAKGFRWEAHPFSFSREPDGVFLRFTVKAIGDFTRRIAALNPGTPVILDGPHGKFTAERCRKQKVLLIAGGIGITPLRSLAAELARCDRETVLLYANRDRASLVFREELEEIAERSGRLRIIYLLSDDPAWTGERGRLDEEHISRLVPDARERDVFLCGPPGMMKNVRAILYQMGLPRKQLHDERFAL